MTIIRPERVDDRAFITSINDLAFGQEDEGVLIDRIRESKEFIPALSLVAEEESTIIGHLLFSRMYIDKILDDGRIVDDTGENEFPLPVLSLAPMSVLPEYQGTGVGSELLIYGLKACSALDFHVVVVVGHPWFYPKFGFTQARLLGLEAPFEVPDEAFMVWEAEQGMIKEVVGGGKGMIRFSPAFDEIMDHKGITSNES